MNKLYGAETPEITDAEKARYALAREAAAEGFVLLKNDGVLPLAPQPIALLGAGARKTMRGGTGSGEVSPRYEITIERGLTDAGFGVTTATYLDDYDKTCADHKAAWRNELRARVEGIANPMQRILSVFNERYMFPEARAVAQADVAGAKTAVYVIMRQAGEANDRGLEPGDYYLTDTEKADLRLLSENCEKLIVVINVGGQIDLGFMDEINVSALVYFAQGGMEGGNALADVLMGKINFSGKLTDTWAARYEDIPFAMEFGRLNGNLDDEFYKEGIFIGYRYFDTFGVKPRYPFGFGLSYTTFDINTRNIQTSGTTATVDVCVTNTGKIAGKEVVQAYISCPSGRLRKEYQRLAAFAKTSAIEAGGSQTVALSFDWNLAASYDEARSAFVLEAGKYVLRVGNSSRGTAIAAVFTLDREVILEQCRPCCAPSAPVDCLTPTDATAEVIPPNTPEYAVDAAAFTTVTHDYAEAAFDETEREKAILDGLTAEEQAELVRGGDLAYAPPNAHIIEGAVGRSAFTLLDKNVPNAVFSDGPAGLNIAKHVREGADGTRKLAELPETYAIGATPEMEAFMVASDGKDIYRHATAWPVATLLAQTWNAPLIESVGAAIGAEMAAYGITLWLAPALNIHRNPLCGRNFEYYSEDPLLSGAFAAAVTKGVQSVAGKGVTIKHFCCNNQEDNRNRVSSNVGERALREIYLKGFEIAVKTGSPAALMTSYNRLNGVYTPNSRELVTDILRGEWGYDGLVMTDWYSCGQGLGDPALCVPSGNDLVMPGSEYDKQAVLEGLGSGKINKADLRRSAARVLRAVLGDDVHKED